MKLQLILTAALTLTLLACGDDATDSGGGGSVASELIPEGYEIASVGRFSPDGQRLAVVAEKGEDTHLVTTDLKGEDVKVWVTEGLSYLSQADWTPDGTTLIFGGDGGILKVALTPDAKPEKLYDSFAVAGLDVSDDGAFVIWAVNGSQDLSRAPLTGELDKKNITKGPKADAPRFSPDGTKVIYKEGSDFKVLAADFSGEATTLDTGETSYLSNADWVDNESVMVLTKEQIIKINVTSGDKTVVDGDVFAVKDLDVSPDGKRYIYNVNGQKSIELR